jgi:hypothetical protein
VPNCPGGGGTAPSISSVKVGYFVQDSISRQINVSWSYAGTGPMYGSFNWNLAGGATQPVPTFSNGLVLLNALAAGTTYDFNIGESNSVGQASYSGQFSTGNAPTNEFVGWVAEQSENSYELDPMGAAPTSGDVTLLAECYGVQGATNTVGFASASTGPTGYYHMPLSFPLNSLIPWNTGGNSYLLESSGLCENVAVFGGENYQNSNYELAASTSNGYWNITRNVGINLGSVNDFQQFALVPNQVVNEPVGIALVHTIYSGTTYNDAECGIEFTQGSTTSQVSQTFTSLNTQFFGLSGSSSANESQTSGDSWSAPGVWGQDTGLSLGYPFSGIATDSSLNSPENGYVVGGEQGVSYGPYSTTDWDATPPTFSGTVPAGYQYALVSPVYDSSSSPTPTQDVFSSGTFTQASELDATISAPIQWAGLTGSLSFKVSYSMSVSTSLGWTVGCNFYNPIDQSNTALWALFYYLNDDTGVASTAVHVWFMGWCATASGEGVDLCPGD